MLDLLDVSASPRRRLDSDGTLGAAVAFTLGDLYRRVDVCACIQMVLTEPGKSLVLLPHVCCRSVDQNKRDARILAPAVA